MNTLKMVVVRHGESLGNTLEHDDRARSEVSTHRYSLTERGRIQAEQTGARLSSEHNFDEVFVSTFMRSIETYECFGWKKDRRIDARVGEKFDGLFHMLTNSEIDLHVPLGQKLRKKYGWYHFRAPGGENGPDVEVRIWLFLTYLVQRYHHHHNEKSKVLVVGHGNWMFCLLRMINNWTPEEADEKRGILSIPNCSIMEVEMNERMDLRMTRTLYTLYDEELITSTQQRA